MIPINSITFKYYLDTRIASLKETLVLQERNGSLDQVATKGVIKELSDIRKLVASGKFDF